MSSYDPSSGDERPEPKQEQHKLTEPTVTKEDAAFFRKEKEDRERPHKTTQWKVPDGSGLNPPGNAPNQRMLMG